MCWSYMEITVLMIHITSLDNLSLLTPYWHLFTKFTEWGDVSHHELLCELTVYFLVHYVHVLLVQLTEIYGSDHYLHEGFNLKGGVTTSPSDGEDTIQNHPILRWMIYNLNLVVNIFIYNYIFTLWGKVCKSNSFTTLFYTLLVINLHVVYHTHQFNSTSHYIKLYVFKDKNGYFERVTCNCADIHVQDCMCTCIF